MESEGIAVAALHGWENGFEGQLSDVDLVIDGGAFKNIAQIVAAHTKACGWRLCQILRHESTAAFCVCSSKQDPTLVVALDICTDYRRNERILIRANELLDGREPLPWGGYRLSESTELRYRFIKGAVKSKDSASFVPIFRQYSETAHKELGKWLMERWKLQSTEWNGDGISQTWRDLERLTREAKVDGWLNGLMRVLLRSRQPSGLLVVGMNDAQDKAVSRCFEHLYFRRQMKVNHFRPTLYLNLVASTLIRCKKLQNIWKRLLESSLYLEAVPNESPSQLTERIAAHLENRCVLREGLSILQ